LRSFPTSLESHRNKPHSIWSPDASRIISSIFTPELTVHGLLEGSVILMEGLLIYSQHKLRAASVYRKVPMCRKVLVNRSTAQTCKFHTRCI
jgi:cytoskeletal protein CcmA (bactofilin family)